jgi:endoglucanase
MINPFLSVATVICWILLGSMAGLDAQTIQNPRGRPTLNAERSTFVGDNGQLLRGPYQSTEWSSAPPYAEVEKIKDLGFNALHLYAEVYNPNYPGSGSVPGNRASEVDKVVNSTRALGLYLVMTIGNGANNGNHNLQYAVDFWSFYANRYKNETHVVFEIHNEPVAWGPPYSSPTANPPGAINLQVSCYNAIRAVAPNTPVLFFSYAVLGGNGGANAALTDIRALNLQLFGNENAVWQNEAVAFHGYAGWEEATVAVGQLLAAGYPCFMTEFISSEWGTTEEGLDVEMTSELERYKVSWLNFLTVPPDGVSPLVTIPRVYKELVDRSGLSWAPDYGTWPAARGVYGNNGLPRKTPGHNNATGTITGTIRIQAEDFDTGGQGVAYNETTLANLGGELRPSEGVDLRSTNDTGGGFAVGWTDSGEWLEYTIFVSEAGFHDLRLRYASPSGGGRVKVFYNDKDRTGEWTLSATGSWDTWSTVTRQVFLERGRRKLRIEIENGGFDLNWYEISPSATGQLANGNYKLVNRNSGLAMTRSGSNIVQSAHVGGNDQLWNFQHVGAGQYRVRSASNNSNWNGAFIGGSPLNLVGWWGIDGRHQRVVVRDVADGYSRFSMGSSGRDLGAVGQSTETGSNINQFNPRPSSPNLQWAIQDATAPSFPSGLSALFIQPTQVHLKWNAVTGAASYQVKRSTTSGGPYAPLFSGITATGFVDATAVAGTTYYYVVNAQFPLAVSLDSGEAAAIPTRVHLRFDESAGTSAPDSSGNNWNGSLVNGPTWSPGIIGNSVNLDGANDHVTLGSGVLSGLSDFSISTWIYLNSVSNWSRIFDFGTGTNNYMFLTPSHSGNRLRFAIRTSSVGEQTITGTSALPAGEWFHVAVTMTHGVGVLYVNGTEVGRNSSMTLTPSLLGNTNQNRIGRSQFSNDPYINGRIDDFRIYSGALNASSVAALATLQSTPPAAPEGLVATGGNATVSLAWNASPGADSYTVKRSAGSGGGFEILASGLTGDAYVDASVLSGSTWYYLISAIGSGGESPNSAEVSATTVPSGLWLAFDEGSGATAADATGNNWTATHINGPTWAPGYTGSAVQFDGTNDHLTLPAGVVSGLDDFTISSWVFVNSLGNWSRVFDFGSSTSNYMFLTPRVGESGNLRFAIRTPSQPEQIINGNAPLPIGVWTHVAVTRSGALGTLYVNGTAVGTNNNLSLKPADLGRSNQNYIGRSQWAGDSYFNGRIDEFRIFGTPLVSVDIAALASGPPVITSPTLANAGVGVPFSYQITASNNPTVYAVTGLPPGFSLEQATGLITGTAAASGAFTVGLSAGNFAGNGAATLALTITSPSITEDEIRGPKVEIVNGSAHFTVSASVVGHIYQLQYHDDLATGPWLDHGEAVAGTGGELNFVMPVESTVPRRFYRIFIRQL